MEYRKFGSTYILRIDRGEERKAHKKAETPVSESEEGGNK